MIKLCKIYYYRQNIVYYISPNHTKNTLSRQIIKMKMVANVCFYVHLRPFSFVLPWCFDMGLIVLISHFSRTHSVSRSPSKLHWNLFERFFLDVHLAFTCAPASVHLTRKNAYAVVEIEDRNGSLTLTQTASPPSTKPGLTQQLYF